LSRNHFLLAYCQILNVLCERGHSLVVYLDNPFPNKSWNTAFRENVKSRLWAKATDTIQGLINTVGPHLSTTVEECPLQNGKCQMTEAHSFRKHQHRFC
jgi:hypothetical protein